MARQTEKKMKEVNGMVISLVSEEGRDSFSVYTKDEWSMGKGCRYPEFDGIESMNEALEVARNY